MLKKYFKMGSVVAIATCLAAVALLSGCDKDDDKKGGEETGQAILPTQQQWSTVGISAALPEVAGTLASSDYSTGVALKWSNSQRTSYDALKAWLIGPNGYRYNDEYEMETYVMADAEKTVGSVNYVATVIYFTENTNLGDFTGKAGDVILVIENGEGGNGDDDGGEGPGTGGNPVLPNGYIWQYDARNNQGMLFEDGNVYMLYYGLPGNTDRWAGREKIGTWEEGSNTIEATFSVDPDVTFTVDGNKLYEYSLPDNVLRASYTRTAGNILGQTTGGGDYENEYAQGEFPALTGAENFKGTTWNGSNNYTLTLANDGTWAVKISGSSALSGKYLVSQNTVHLYVLEGRSYYQNGYGTMSGTTLTMEGGAASLGGQTWTKQTTTGGDVDAPGANIISAYRGEYDDYMIYDGAEEVSPFSFTLTENKLITANSTEVIGNLATGPEHDITYFVYIGTWAYLYSGNTKVGIVYRDEEVRMFFIGASDELNEHLTVLNALGAGVDISDITTEENHSARKNLE
ncbi:MAG: hypothetical protein LBU91_06585 [Bacteroidales bacterium]|jgi:hypothetical protein|nr:hypothetical protein [Bacteroidales bacterium]